MVTEMSEQVRLRRVLETGPWRRMAQDRALGMGPQRADMVQAKQYRLLLEALDSGADERDVEPAEVGDVLALDRTERD